MKLRDIMTEEVEIIRPGETLTSAAQIMRDRDIGALPVCDGDRLVGMLTDRDLTVRAVAVGVDPNSTRVEEAMSPDIAWCFDDQDASHAGEIMQNRQVRRLAVINRDKQLVGIVSLGDLATTGESGAKKTLERVSAPAE